MKSTIMNSFQIMLTLSALLCSLTAGLLFAFAVVVMPGIKHLGDREFIRTFQGIDGIIQRGQPFFMMVWIGSVIVLLITTVLGFWELSADGLILLLSAAFIYLLGVQLPTAIINIPLNNKLQTLDVQAMDEPALHTKRQKFEPRWNRWNRIRTVFAVFASLNLLILHHLL